MVVRSARHDAEVILHESVGKGAGVFHDLALILAESRLERLVERHGLCRDNVHERAPLDTGKDLPVHGFGVLLLAHDHAAPRPAQGLVRRRRHKVCLRHRARVLPAGDQAGDVRDIGHEVRADLVRDRPEPGKVEDPRVRARPDDDHLRLVLHGKALYLVVVEHLRVPAHAIGYGIIDGPRKTDGRAVGQVPAVGQGHAEDRVAGPQHAEVRRHIGLRPGVGLHIDVFRAEELLRPGDGEFLNLVGELTPAVVAPVRIPFGIFVRQHGALCLQNGIAYVIFRGNEHDLAQFALFFTPDRR